MDITVKMRYYKESPSKIRPYLMMAKNKKCNQALSFYEQSKGKAPKVLYKLILSGISAAKEKELDEDKLIIKNICCDKANSHKRQVPKARGRSSLIRKRLSHITLVISDVYQDSSKKSAIKSSNLISKKDKKEKNGTKS